MKKSIKKVISMFLCLVILSASVLTTLAATTVIKTERDIPMIDVHGFMASDIYEDPSNPNSKLAWPLSSDDIMGAVEDMVSPLSRLAMGGSWENFADEITPIADKLFDPVCSDYNGEVTNGSGIRFEYPAPEELTTDSIAYFKYDWRLDPIVIAAQLNDFINYVLDCTESEQVTLTCHSLGGVITLSYLTIYGSEKVRSVAFNTTAIYGETYTGELLTGQLQLNDQAVKHYLDYAFTGMEFDSLLSLITGAVTDAGVTAFISDYANDIVDIIYDRISLSVAHIFANWPTIWAMIPDDMVENAKKHVFNEIYSPAGVDFTGLQEKVENYNTLVRKDKTQTLLNLNENTNVYVLARYGYSSLPMTPSWDIMSDGVIDTQNNSFGATTAKINKTLHVPITEYVNPDETVDASTCLFPEQTWFIKNLKHADMPVAVNRLIEKLLYFDGQATVDTFGEYPRFMEYDYDYNCLKTDTKTEYISFWDKIIDMIMQIFKNLFR